MHRFDRSRPQNGIVRAAIPTETNIFWCLKRHRVSEIQQLISRCASRPTGSSVVHNGTLPAIQSRETFMFGQAKKLSLLFIIAAGACAQSTPPREKCKFDPKQAQALRRVSALAPVAYYFACQENNPNADSTGCIQATVKPGLLVSLNRAEGPWACVSGKDSTSGWIRKSKLQALRPESDLPLKTWEGWWQHPAAERVRDVRNDRLLITAGTKPDWLRISGRAYWYGTDNVVHYGQISGKAMPVERYLHAVAGSCVVDLEMVSSEPAEIQAVQNEFEAGACGGMN